MKRTHRWKDWDQTTAIGIQMFKALDRRAWHHIFDGAVLLGLLQEAPSELKPKSSDLANRPVLRLALEQSPLLDRAIQTEIDFWRHLDRIRLEVYARSAEAYGHAVMKNKAAKTGDLLTQHEARVRLAETHLPRSPLAEYGVQHAVDTAIAATAVGLDPSLLEYLPQVTSSFQNLEGPT